MGDQIQKIQFELNAIGEAIVEGLRNGLSESNASGNLKASIEYKAQAYLPQDGDLSKLKITFQILMDEYWYFVENGRKSGRMPPVAPIEKWIRNKETFKIKEKSKDKKGKIKYKSIAFAIAMKIKKYGTKGNQFFSKVVNDNFYLMFNEKLELWIGEAIELSIEDIIKK